jgi:hypothetical protein
MSLATNLDFAAAYLLARAHVRSELSFVNLTKIIGSIFLIVAPFAILESATGIAPILQTLDKLNLSNIYRTTAIDYRFSLVRARVFMVHPIHFGIFASVAFTLSLLELSKKSSVTNIFKTTGAIVCIICSISSSALIGALMTIALIGWVTIMRHIKRKWLALVLLIICGYVTVDLMSNRTPIRVAMSYITFSSHTAFYRAAIFEYGIQNVWQNPIFGLGTRDWIRAEWLASSSVDNFWLLTTMKYGIPALVLISTAIASTFLNLMKAPTNNHSGLVTPKLIYGITATSLVFMLSTVHVWHSSYSLIAFLFGIGLFQEMSQRTGEDLIQTQENQRVLYPLTRFGRTAQSSSKNVTPQNLGRNVTNLAKRKNN